MRVSEGAARLVFDLRLDPERVGGEVLRLRSTSDGSGAESGWDEPMAPGSGPAATGGLP